MAREIDCPRCDGTGLIRVMQPPQPGRGEPGKRQGIEGDCPVCRGTGKASMLDRMGPREKGPGW